MALADHAHSLPVSVACLVDSQIALEDLVQGRYRVGHILTTLYQTSNANISAHRGQMGITPGPGVFYEPVLLYRGLMKKIRTDRFNDSVVVSRFF